MICCVNPLTALGAYNLSIETENYVYFLMNKLRKYIIIILHNLKSDTYVAHSLKLKRNGKKRHNVVKMTS